MQLSYQFLSSGTEFFLLLAATSPPEISALRLLDAEYAFPFLLLNKLFPPRLEFEVPI